MNLLSRFDRQRWALLFGLLAAFTCSLGRSDTAPDDGPWRFTIRKPADGWQQPDFDDSGWREGHGGFGVRSTPGARVGTDWATDNIWLRRTFELTSVPEQSALLIHHDEDTEVFLNGRPVAQFKNFTTEYKVVPLSAAARDTLRAGMNLLGVHCRQTTGGQFIDVHVVDAANVPKLPEPQRPTRPFQSDLITAWGAQVTPENVWREYPRPQMARENWQNLNGLWDYAITKRDAPQPTDWAGEILVPFCLEAKLSGVQRLLDPTEALWYRRSFQASPTDGCRLLLNFEAVDYSCQAWVNGMSVGQHMGGNNPFQFDVTEALQDGENELVLRVKDATGGFQLRGKQTLDPHGIWYTRVSGIWQTVWLEEVPERHFTRLHIDGDPDSGRITITPQLAGRPLGGEQLRAVALDGDQLVAEAQGELSLRIGRPKPWTPDRPQLYQLRIRLLDAQGHVVDEVASYTALRAVGTTRGADGHLRFTLNGDVIFHWGPLDQGWWPDGLLTPPSDAAQLSDIEFLKRAGFNMIRKHIKVEPRRYYYHCDRLGMMVWQDHVSGGANPPWTRLKPDPQDAVWSDADHAQFMAEFREMIDHLRNHPSIVVWVPFNEAWGQHRTLEVGRWIAEYDPTRPVNIASGGNFWPGGDVADAHSYPHPSFPFDPRFNDFVLVVGEFGGHGWPVTGHLWDSSRRNWGYGGLPKSLDEYRERYRESLRLLTELKDQGIAAGVYTQTTDVEGEINGLLTYDRKVTKIPAAELSKLHEPLLAD